MDPNGSSPKIGPDRPSVYTGLSLNWSETDPKLDLFFLEVQFWISSGTVPERSRVNRIRSGLVQFWSDPM